MEIETYNLYLGNVCVGKDMDLEHVLLLTKAIFRDDTAIQSVDDIINIRIERVFRPLTKEEVDNWV